DISQKQSSRCNDASQNHLLTNGQINSENRDVYQPTTSTSPMLNVLERLSVRNPDSPFALLRLFQAFLYMIQLTLAYWLMLIAMTYNVWLTAAVVIGAAFGHWLFAVLRFFSSHADRLDSFVTDACH
ncbi:hypothetical protein AB6A40_003733, partial [Gnathostoma spinigerum]